MITNNVTTTNNAASTITDERRAFLSKIGRRGGLKRAEAFTSEFQRMARAHVAHDSNVANGRKGGIAYVRKHGKRRLAEQARQYRLAHPSNLEQIVETALIAIGATGYEREGFIFPKSHCHVITGDFVFRQSKPHRVVYADGKMWHVDHTTLAGCAERGTKDEHYDNYLVYRGWQVLRLTQAEIEANDRGTDEGAMLGKLRTFLQLESAA